MLKMSRGILALVLLAWLAFILGENLARASTTKVGNGDDGRDLEGATAITSGKILDTKAKALDLVQTLKLQGVGGLGLLIPELERSRLYMTKMNSQAVDSEEQGRFHADMRGFVYARTFAEPHAATRFFPVAEKLDQDQLVALHIHEALHRSLPPAVRENESVVTQITLAITAPGASQDTVTVVVAKHVPIQDRLKSSDSNPSVASKYPIPDDAPIRRPTIFKYGYRGFTYNDEKENTEGFSSMQTLTSEFYPFGDDEKPLGLGIELSWINKGKKSKESLTGPLNIYAKKRLWSPRGFDVGIWGAMSLNTMSDEKLKKNPYSRDVMTIGLSASREDGFFYIDNFIGYTTSGKTKQTYADSETNYNFGSVITASVHPGIKPFRGLKIGGFGEVYLLEGFKITAPEYEDDFGRTQILAVGPEVQYHWDRITLAMSGRYIASSSNEDAKFDWMGNIMGAGVGTSSWGASLAVNF